MKIYCEVCGKSQDIRIDPMCNDQNFPEQGIWGDLMCSVCNLVIATVSVENEGIYEFKKISDLDKSK